MSVTSHASIRKTVEIKIKHDYRCTSLPYFLISTESLWVAGRWCGYDSMSFTDKYKLGPRSRSGLQCGFVYEYLLIANYPRPEEVRK